MRVYQDPQSEEKQEYLDNENFDILVQQYEDPTRMEWQNPDYVIEKLGNLENTVVADIGVGSGYFAFRIAEKADKVIAIDIDQRFLDYIDELKEESSDEEVDERLQTRLALEDDPLLAPQEVDLVLMVNTYHFLSSRAEYLRRVRTGLKRNGKIILVDFKMGRMPVGPPEQLKVSRLEAMSDLKKAGFTNLEADVTSLQFQYIITAYNR